MKANPLCLDEEKINSCTMSLSTSSAMLNWVVFKDFQMYCASQPMLVAAW
jgi:hypothetical protein